jgi:hypothetical protein
MEMDRGTHVSFKSLVQEALESCNYKIQELGICVVDHFDKSDGNKPMLKSSMDSRLPLFCAWYERNPLGISKFDSQ